MAQPILLPAAFDGMAQDFPRNNMPKGKAWNLVDYVPQQLGAAATERGGWAFASASLAGVDGAATFIKAMLYAPFTAGGQLLSIVDSSSLIKTIAGVNTLAAGGGISAPPQNPFMHQQLVVIPSADGVTLPRKYDGTTHSAIAGAPAGRYGAVFVNYAWLGGAVANPQRAYASAVGDPTSWVTSGVSASTMDFSFPIKGFAALPNVLLVFGDTVTARMRGTTPPPQTDMQIDDPLFNFGCIDARSIAVNGSLACFANAQGVFLTNGTAFPENLTKSCGIWRYWINLMSTYSASWTVAGGWFGDSYVISVMNGTTLIDTILFDTKLRQAYRLSNLKSMAFTSAGAAGQELYAGSRATPRIMQLSTMFTPSATYKADGDGTPVLAVWETPFYDTHKVGGQRWKDAWLDYDLRDAAADGPLMTLAYCKSPEIGSAYTTLAQTAPATTARRLIKIPVQDKSWGMGFKVTRANAAALARIYGIGSSASEREGSRRDY